MADDQTKTTADRKRVDVHDDYECRYWSEKFGVSADELKLAISNAGDRVDDVARELGEELYSEVTAAERQISRRGRSLQR
ncbi:MAG TPA: DUF3606 domain-containing protein [Pseudolabrys sp.]|nr:DUF3606 domain-containing protein [Pseudolabrys sp.]